MLEHPSPVDALPGNRTAEMECTSHPSHPRSADLLSSSFMSLGPVTATKQQRSLPHLFSPPRPHHFASKAIVFRTNHAYSG